MISPILERVEAEAPQRRLARWLYAYDARTMRRFYSPNSIFHERWEDGLWWRVNDDEHRDKLVRRYMDMAAEIIRVLKGAE